MYQRLRHSVRISIHAPRTGSDTFTKQFQFTGSDFNPRSPHGERRDDAQIIAWCAEFQSTLPARGATSSDMSFILLSFNFNPRSPHGERR